MRRKRPRKPAASGRIVVAVGLLTLLTGCDAWRDEAPVRWQAPRCATLSDRLTELRAHVAVGGVSALRDLLDTKQASADLHTLMTLGQRAARRAAETAPVEPVDGDSASRAGTAASNAAGADGGDAADGLAWLNALMGELLAPPPGQPNSLASLDTVAAAGACGDADAWRLIATVLRDDRAASTLRNLARAALRPTSTKQAELAPVGLDETTSFLQLVNTLLRSLADPAFDPTTLLELLAGLASSPDGILSALGTSVQLLVSTSDGLVDAERRASTARLLTCARAHDDTGALPWLLHGLLVRQPGLATPLPGVKSWRAALSGGAWLADAFAASEPGQQALQRLMVGALQPAVIDDMRSLLQQPIASEVAALAVGLANAATCAQP